MCRYILEHGEDRPDRTGTGTRSVFGYQTRYDLREGFPLLTTKKMYLRPIAEELLWFIKGDTNIKYLVDRNVKIWNEWPYEDFKKSEDFNGETLEEFVEKIKNDDEFAKKHGNLGPVYGAQWRNFNNEGTDQLMKLIDSLKNNPFSRRHIISAWNPSQVDEMALPPCHYAFQFYVSEGKLSCMFNMRSVDVFLGLPFNIASYALLTMMIAQVCDLELGELIFTGADTHIYLNHLEQVNELLSRDPNHYPYPAVAIDKSIKHIDNFRMEHFTLVNYQYYPAIKAPMAV